MIEQVDPRAWWLTRTYPQFFLSGREGGIFCYDTPVMTIAVAEVICRQVHSQFLHRISKGTKPTNYLGHFYDGIIDCTGDEPGLSWCDVNVFAVEDCLDGYTIVECSTGMNNYSHAMNMDVHEMNHI